MRLSGTGKWSRAAVLNLGVAKRKQGGRGKMFIFNVYIYKKYGMIYQMTAALKQRFTEKLTNACAHFTFAF